MPSVADSQKEFNAITIVLSTAKLSQDKINLINTDIENFSRKAAPDWTSSFNFYMATNKKASLNMSITGLK